MSRTVAIGKVKIGGKEPLALIAGPCSIESRSACLDIAGRLAEISRRAKIPLVFKASYDKANRSSLTSWRGPGLARGLEILAEVKKKCDLPVLTDVHSPAEARLAAEVVDAIQIPAFLCRQTDLVIAAGNTGKPVNVKKGQFLAPWDMRHVVEKIESTGNKQVLLTERGVCFGYNNLVADMRSLIIMAEIGYPVVFDATHSVQRPGGAGACSTGDSAWAPGLARAAVATGCDAVFLEVHPRPQRALSDKDTVQPIGMVEGLWKALRRIDEIVAHHHG